MKYSYNVESGILDLTIDGDVDNKTCVNIRSVIDGYIIKYSPAECIIDLSNVKFMDSSGIGLLMGRYNLIKMLDSKMTVKNPSKSIRKILDMTSMGKYINIKEETINE